MVDLTFDECPTCGAYDFVATHRCPPAWYVKIAECDYHHDESEPTRVFAQDAEQAAERFAEEWDCRGDPCLLSGDTLTVSVSALSNLTEVQTFAVTGEMVPEYRACEKETE